MFDTHKLQRPRQRQRGAEFRITHVLIGKYGKTEGCPGCLKHEGGPIANKSLECRQRFEDLMLQDDVLREGLFARDIRAEEGASTKARLRDDGVQELSDEPSNTHSCASRGVADRHQHQYSSSNSQQMKTWKKTRTSREGGFVR